MVAVIVFETALLGGIVGKPVILTVDDDDDPEVSRAVERDLRRRCACEYRVSRASSGDSGLETPGSSSGGDQRMSRMTGVEFLEQASKLFPEQRVLS